MKTPKWKADVFLFRGFCKNCGPPEDWLESFPREKRMGEKCEAPKQPIWKSVGSKKISTSWGNDRLEEQETTDIGRQLTQSNGKIGEGTWLRKEGGSGTLLCKSSQCVWRLRFKARRLATADGGKHIGVVQLTITHLLTCHSNALSTYPNVHVGLSCWRVGVFSESMPSFEAR